MSELLLATAISVTFGGVKALLPFDLMLPDDSGVTALIGANGAGKTTVINALSGALPVTSGRVMWQGRDVSSLGLHRRARLGLMRTFQRTGIFDGLTVHEHLKLATRRARDPQSPGEWLREFGLHHRSSSLADSLPHVEQRLLEIVCVLATGPRLVLLDEPTSGMDSEQVARVHDAVMAIKERVPVLIVEHDIDFVIRTANRIIVMERGNVIADGDPAAVQQDKGVARTYLGRFAK